MSEVSGRTKLREPSSSEDDFSVNWVMEEAIFSNTSNGNEENIDNSTWSKPFRGKFVSRSPQSNLKMQLNRSRKMQGETLFSRWRSGRKKKNKSNFAGRASQDGFEGTYFSDTDNDDDQMLGSEQQLLLLEDMRNSRSRRSRQRSSFQNRSQTLLNRLGFHIDMHPE